MQNKKPIDYTPKAERKVEEPRLQFKACCVCNGVVTQGYYGRHAGGGTCCKKCETLFEDQKLMEGK